jgi:hypothetical protein
MLLQNNNQEYTHFTAMESSHISERICDSKQVDGEKINEVLLSNLLIHSELFGYNLFHFTPHEFKLDSETQGYGMFEKFFKKFFPYDGSIHDILAVMSLGDEEAGDYTIITKELLGRILVSKRPDINTYITKRILFPQHEQTIRQEPKKK